MVVLGADCSKNKKIKIIGVTKKIKNKVVRIYNLFRSGLVLFNRCYDSDRKKYNFKFSFILYDIQYGKKSKWFVWKYMTSVLVPTRRWFMYRYKYHYGDICI